ncbi:MAG: GNAT family N-acetyltransferase [Rhabdaerophilum calidifontis]
MSPFLRPATSADIPALRDLLVATWHETYDAIYGREKVDEITGRWHSEARLADQVRQAAAHPHREVMLIAEGAEGLLGTVSMHRQSEEVVDLGRLYVRAGAQGHGLGWRLMRAALARFPEARRVRLDVEPENARAIRFYSRHGFRVITRGTACGGDAAAAITHLVMEAALPLFRPARDSDAQDLYGLITLCFAEYPGCVTDPHDDMPDIARAGAWPVRERAGRRLGGHFLVIEDEEGRVGASIAIDFPAGDTGELHRLYVRPDLRGRGLAARLVGECERIARDSGASRLLAWSDTRFEAAHRLYRRRGYRAGDATRALGDISRSVEYCFELIL